MDVPEMPLSYSCTGAINSVTPIALMMPAISSIKKWKGESLARMSFSKSTSVVTGWQAVCL